MRRTPLQLLQPSTSQSLGWQRFHSNLWISDDICGSWIPAMHPAQCKSGPATAVACCGPRVTMGNSRCRQRKPAVSLATLAALYFSLKIGLEQKGELANYFVGEHGVWKHPQGTGSKLKLPIPKACKKKWLPNVDVHIFQRTSKETP